ncbi:hypothetical protein QE152_g33713 [Popillia japonica]|uniref:Uncharacterized protein n=1 Tax=Popillia japonica TaxID=7064 RepID=A0AAW1IWC8_POPJA
MLTIIGEDYHQKATSYKDSGSDFMRLSKAAYLMLTIIGEDYHQKATSYKDSGSDFMRIARMYSTLEDVTYRCTARDVTALMHACTRPLKMSRIVAPLGMLQP